MDNRSVMVGGREGILGEWGMEVSSPVYEGKIPAREALEQSKIAATVRFADQTGLQRVVDTACAFGLPLQKAELLRRLAVGFEEVSMKQAVRAMAAFPSGGRLGPEQLVYVDRVENPPGRVVYRRQRQPVPRTEVIDAATAWQVHSMMAGSLYRGSSKGALDGLVEKPFNGAGKGGTTHDFGDCWFLGYNKRVTCGVWTGFLIGQWRADLSGCLQPRSRDAGLAGGDECRGSLLRRRRNWRLRQTWCEVPVCSVSGQRATQFCQEYVEDPGSGVVRSRSTGGDRVFPQGHRETAVLHRPLRRHRRGRLT